MPEAHKEKIEEAFKQVVDHLEERKTKKDRRVAHDPTHPNASPETCRRSGKDRREEAE